MKQKLFNPMAVVIAIIIMLLVASGVVYAGNNTDSSGSNLATPGSGHVSADSNQQGVLPTLAEQLPEPPANFNPLTATSAELSKYGFPEKPTSEMALKVWEEAMAHSIYYVKPDQKPSTSVHGLVRTTYSTNWAGYVDKATDNIKNGYTPIYYTTFAKWTQPSYPSGNADPSFWTGIGGYINSNCVVQAGADSNALAPGVGGSSRYEFWVEDFPLGTVWEAQPAVHAGDTIYVTVQYSASTSTATAYLDNMTTGQYTSVVFNAPNYDGSSADYIYEAVGVPTLPYGSWGSTTFSNCALYWKDSSGAQGGGAFEAYNYSKIIMRTAGGVIKGEPSAPIYDGFQMTSH